LRFNSIQDILKPDFKNIHAKFKSCLKDGLKYLNLKIEKYLGLLDDCALLRNMDLSCKFMQLADALSNL